jgi:hypothetical protein
MHFVEHPLFAEFLIVILNIILNSDISEVNLDSIQFYLFIATTGKPRETTPIQKVCKWLVIYDQYVNSDVNIFVPDHQRNVVYYNLPLALSLLSFTIFFSCKDFRKFIE